MYKKIGKKSISLVLAIIMLFSMVPTFTIPATASVADTSSSNFIELTTDSYDLIDATYWGTTASATTTKTYFTQTDYKTIKFDITLPNIDDYIAIMDGNYGSYGGGKNFSMYDEYSSSSYAIFFKNADSVGACTKYETGVIEGVGVTQAVFRDALLKNQADLQAGKTVTLELPLDGAFPLGASFKSIEFMFSKSKDCGGATGYAEHSMTISNVEFPYCLDSFSTPVELTNGNEYTMQSTYWGSTKYNLYVPTTPTTIDSKVTRIRFNLKFEKGVAQKVIDNWKTGSYGGSTESVAGENSESADAFKIYFDGADYIGARDHMFRAVFENRLDELNTGKYVTMDIPVHKGSFSSGTINGIYFSFDKEGKIGTEKMWISDVELYYQSNATTQSVPLASETNTMTGHYWWPQLVADTAEAVPVNPALDIISFDLKLQPDKVDEIINLFIWGSDNGNANSDGYGYGEGDFAIWFMSTKDSGNVDTNRKKYIKRVGVRQEEFYRAMRGYQADLRNDGTVSMSFKLEGSFAYGDEVNALCMMMTHETLATTQAIIADAFAGTSITLSNVRFDSSLHHTFKLQPAIPGSCTEQGYSAYYKCDRCGLQTARMKMPHNANRKVTNIPATCTTNGYAQYTCVDCNDSYKIDTEKALGHASVNGGTADIHTKCNRCGITLSSTHTYTSTVLTPATCLTKGTTKYTCECGYTYNSQDIAVNPNNHEGTVVDAGSTDVHSKYNCCNAVVSTVHSFTVDSGIKFSDATCTAKQKNYLRCSCGYNPMSTSYLVEVGSVLPHPAGPVIVENSVAPTCTVDGSYENATYCTVCKVELSRTKVTVPAINHKWDSGVETTAPTCTKDGVKTYTCQNNKSHTYTEPIAMLGHKMGDWNQTLAPKCYAYGEKRRDCDRCDYYETERVEKLDHNCTTTVIAPTCTSQGYTLDACQNDGCIYENRYNPKGILVHTYTEAITKQPTCTEEGVKTFTCSVCSHSYTETLLVKGHDLVYFEGQNPDHENNIDGWWPYAECKNCDYTTYKVIPANPTADGITSFEQNRLNAEPWGSGESEFDGMYQLTEQEKAAQVEVYKEAQKNPAYSGTSMMLNMPYLWETNRPDHHYVTEAKWGDIYLNVYGRVTVDVNVPANAETFELRPGWGMYANCKILAQIPGSDEWFVVGRILDEVNAGTTVYANQGLTDEEIANAYKYILANSPVEVGADGNEIKKIRLMYVPDSEYGEQPACYQGKISICNIVYFYGLGDGVINSNEYTKPKSYEDANTADMIADYPSIVREHTDVQLIPAVPATCTTAGKTEGKECKECGAVLIAPQDVPAHGHIYGSRADCTKPSKCIVCHTTLQAQTDHDYNVVVTAPTCTDKGYTTHTCKRCGYNYVDAEVAANGHEPGSVATCTEPQKCTVCKVVLVDALGHKEGAPVIENSTGATCTEPGSFDTVTYCTVCGKELSRETVTVDALGHKPGAAATCTEPQKCTVCGKVLVDALGHTEGQIVVENNVAPDCENTGSYDNVVYCTVCGEELSRETITVDALGHREVVDEAVAPTYTSTGLTQGSHCSVCGEILIAQEVIPALIAVAYNVNTDTYYGDFNIAINEAVSGETVKLLADITDTASSTVVVKNGVTLDLNGKLITALNFLSFGDVIDVAGNGGIVIDEDTTKAFTVFAETNTYMPIYDVENGCYRVFKYTFTNKGAVATSTTDKIKFRFALVFENMEAYRLLAANPSSLAMSVEIKINPNDESGQTFEYNCDSKVLAAFASVVYDLSKTDGIYITFDVDNVDRLYPGSIIYATPTITSTATGVTETANSKTYLTKR